MFIESLEDDQSSLRACSLVSSTFRHFCNPILYRDIELDREETVDAFIQDGARSDFLQHIKSLSLTYYGFMSKAHRHKPNRILHVALRKASLDALRLHKIHFQAEPFAASIMSKLSTVTVLVLHGCLFEGICDFISFIRCFPRCEVLRLRGCHWIPRAKPESGGQPSYDVAPTHLEITNTSIPYGRSDYRDQGGIVGMAWLDLTGLKSFTYTFEDDIPSERVFGGVAASEHLEEINVAIARSEPRDSGECDSVSWSSNAEVVETIEISDYPADPTRRSHQVSHPQVRQWPLSLVGTLLHHGIPALPNSRMGEDRLKADPYDRRLRDLGHRFFGYR